MPQILKRILLNGFLAAGALAVVGYGYAELASIFLVAKSPQRPMSEAPVAAPANADPMAESLRYRVPAMMALWGFLFVAAGEGALHWWRRRKGLTPSEAKPIPVEVQLQ